MSGTSIKHHRVVVRLGQPSRAPLATSGANRARQTRLTELLREHFGKAGIVSTKQDALGN